MNTSKCPSLPQRLLSRPQGRSYQASHRGAGDMVSPVSSPFAHQPTLVFRVTVATGSVGPARSEKVVQKLRTATW